MDHVAMRARGLSSILELCAQLESLTQKLRKLNEAGKMTLAVRKKAQKMLVGVPAILSLLELIIRHEKRLP